MGAITGTDVKALVDAWRIAATGMDQLDDRVEREVGKTSLRLAAAATVRQLSTRAVGLDEPTLAPARQWTADYVGGERAEAAVNQIDAQARKVAISTLNAVGTWAWTGNAPVLWSGFVGVAAGIFLAVADFGHDAASAVLAGAVPGGLMYYLLRGVVMAGNKAPEAVRTTWDDAQAIGTRADKVMAPVVEVERRLWQAAGGASRPADDFTSKARNRAQWIVAIAVGVACAGMLAFAVGAVQAISEWNATYPGT